jgi:hypothetical protein
MTKYQTIREEIRHVLSACGSLLRCILAKKLKILWKLFLLGSTSCFGMN